MPTRLELNLGQRGLGSKGLILLQALSTGDSCAGCKGQKHEGPAELASCKTLAYTAAEQKRLALTLCGPLVL